jgi:death-on-curing protein
VTWRWIGLDLALAVHERQLAEHGGLGGIRDRGAVESALARPVNLAGFDSAADAPPLAAAYCFGIVRNHGFADGNKRTGWVLARLFLLDNGIRVAFAPEDVVRMIQSLAAGEIAETRLAEWIRAHIAA